MTISEGDKDLRRSAVARALALQHSARSARRAASNFLAGTELVYTESTRHARARTFLGTCNYAGRLLRMFGY